METLELKNLSLDDLMDGIGIGEVTEEFNINANKSECNGEGHPQNCKCSCRYK